MKSLPEVHGSVPIPHGAGFWRKMMAFAGPGYLHPRPSAAGKGYDAAASSGSNYGPMNPDYAARVKTDADALRTEGGAAIPVDAVTTSGSGLDPDISPAYAERQIQRIADARGATPARVREDAWGVAARQEHWRCGR